MIKKSSDNDNMSKSNNKGSIFIIIFTIIIVFIYCSMKFFSVSTKNITKKESSKFSEYETYAVNILKDWNTFLEYYLEKSDNTDSDNFRIENVKINSLSYIVPKNKEQFSLLINYDYVINKDNYHLEIGTVGTNNEFNLVGESEIQMLIEDFEKSISASK